MFILQNAPLKIPSISGLSSRPLLELADNGTSKFDLTLTLMEGIDGLTGTAEYNTDLFDESTIDRLLGHYRTLLEAVVAVPDLELARLPLLTQAEKRQLDEWGLTRADYPEGECISELFEAQAARTPDAEAVVGDGRRLTYGELNRRANRLAHRLRSLGVGPEGLVGLYLDRSPELLVGLLAVLKAGGAYVPLDPAYPGERVAAVMEDAGLRWVLTQLALADDLPRNGARLLCVDAEERERAPGNDESLARSANAENLAYVIYTSGSTGKPKGVMLTHRGLCNAYRAWENAYRLRTETTSHLQMASCAFDVFTGDWTRALCSGGKLVLCPREALLDAPRLYELMRREGVDCAEFVPAVLRNLVRYLEQTGQTLGFMRLLAAGSDVWYAGEYRRIKNLCGSGRRLINSYGLTEATIDSTYFEGDALDLPESRPVPIGRPFANTRVRILDRNLQPVPVGAAGELHVGGPGLARGYFNRPELTSEKFIADPFAEAPGDRLFRTGDLARWLPDGCVELVGRSDDQVKVRGFRIEPGEIESVLGRHPAVRQAVVVVRGDTPDRKHLVAFVTTDGPAPAAAELRAFLKDKLPEYMVPSAFAVLEAMPLTPNGKIDRKALPAVEAAPESRADFVPRARPSRRRRRRSGRTCSAWGASAPWTTFSSPEAIRFWRPRSLPGWVRPSGWSCLCAACLRRRPSPAWRRRSRRPAWRDAPGECPPWSLGGGKSRRRCLSPSSASGSWTSSSRTARTTTFPPRPASPGHWTRPPSNGAFRNSSAAMRRCGPHSGRSKDGRSRSSLRRWSCRSLLRI